MTLIDRLFDNLVLIACLLPLVGAALTWASARRGADVVRWTALANAISTLILAGLVFARYDFDRPFAGGERATLQMVSTISWNREAPPTADPASPARANEPLPVTGMQFAFGIDGISVWFFLATATLIPVAILLVSGLESRRAAEESAWLLVVESMLLTLFAALDLALYLASLGVLSAALAWLLSRTGSLQRRAAALRFFGLQSAALLLWMMAFAVLIAAALQLTHSEELASSEVVVAPTSVVPWLSAHGALPRSLGVSTVAWYTMLCGCASLIQVGAFPVSGILVAAVREASAAVRLLLTTVVPGVALFALMRFDVPIAAAPGGSGPGGLLTFALLALSAGGLLATRERDPGRLLGSVGVGQVLFAMCGVLSVDAIGFAGALVLWIGASAGMTACVVHNVVKATAVNAARWILICAGLIGGFAGGVLIVFGVYRSVSQQMESTVGGTVTMTGLLLFGLLAHASNVARLLSTMLAARPSDSILAPSSLDSPSLRGRFASAVVLAAVAIAIAVGVTPQFILSRTEPAIGQVLGIEREPPSGAEAGLPRRERELLNSVEFRP